MGYKKGHVRQVSKDGWALVVTERDDACKNCLSAQFCHSLADCTRMETRVLNRANAAVGDRVTISLSSSSVYKSAMILYILPTLSLIGGAISGYGIHQFLGMHETGAAILFSFLGLLLGFTIAGLISRHQNTARKLTPVITGIIQPAAGSRLSWKPVLLKHKQ
jgi:positive regulator of sigma E activity